MSLFHFDELDAQLSRPDAYRTNGLVWYLWPYSFKHLRAKLTALTAAYDIQKLQLCIACAYKTEYAHLTVPVCCHRAHRRQIWMLSPALRTHDPRAAFSSFVSSHRTLSCAKSTLTFTATPWHSVYIHCALESHCVGVSIVTLWSHGA